MLMHVPHPPGFVASSGIPPGQAQPCITPGRYRPPLAPHATLDVPGMARSGSLPCRTHPHTLLRDLCCFCAINEL